MRKVYDYIDIRKLKDTPVFNLLRKSTLLTATGDLSSAIKDFYPCLKHTTYDIHAFIDKMVPQWEDEIKDVRNYVALRNIIEEYCVDHNLNREISAYLRRNAYDMWNAVKLLVEADVFPMDINVLGEGPVSYFKDIWKKLEVDNPQIMDFRKAFRFDLAQREKIVEKLKVNGKEDVLTDHIFLIGFYFITPIQERIFDILENLGCTLVFLNCHNKSYPFTSEIWEATYEEYSKGTVKDIQSSLTFENDFGEAINNGVAVGNVSFTKHHTDIEFANMVKNAYDHGEKIYSPDAKGCNEILKEYYPECYEDKHLLSYPVGQYIYNLHSLWDSVNDNENVKFENVYKCFASGWLIAGDEQNGWINGKDYIYELKILKVFFEGCNNIESWKNRLNNLKEAKSALSGFTQRNHGTERWHRLMGDPFYKLGVYSISLEVIIDISRLLDALFADYEELFSGNVTTDLYSHFNKIALMIDSHMQKEDFFQDEKDIVNDLLFKLNDKANKGVACHISGIRDALMMLIGGKYSEYESFENETKKKEGLVSPLSNIEAEILSNKGQTVHLVYANEFNLPGPKRKLPWPLTDDVLNSLKIGRRRDTQRYVNDMREIIEKQRLSRRYLFSTFIGINNKENPVKINIEWVCEKDNKKVDITPYAKLLDSEVAKIDIDQFDAEKMSKILASDKNVCGQEICFPGETAPEEVKMDWMLCDRRYEYSYVLNYLPTYTSEFHYSFLLSNLIGAITSVSELKKDVVANNLFQLFPFLKHIQKRQASDFSNCSALRESYSEDNVEYPSKRLAVHYINKDVLNMAQKLRDEYVDSGIVNKHDTSCVYCPYSEICFKRYELEVD